MRNRTLMWVGGLLAVALAFAFLSPGESYADEGMRRLKITIHNEYDHDLKALEGNKGLSYQPPEIESGKDQDGPCQIAYRRAVDKRQKQNTIWQFLVQNRQ